MITDMPYKILNAISFNLIIYFMTNLRVNFSPALSEHGQRLTSVVFSFQREPGAFFFFVLISFTLTMTMSMFFRSVASLSRTLSQALVPGSSRSYFSSHTGLC